jgi:hypothetical protein
MQRHSRMWRQEGVALVALLCLAGGSPANAGDLAKCDGTSGYKAISGVRTFLWRPEWLALEKRRLGNDAAQAGVLRKAADAALTRGPYTVTAKSRMPSSDDKHDYYSIGPYWWPDANKAGGLPYIRRDGETNPESRGSEFDKDRLTKFAKDVQTLALAAHHLGERRYAEHAAKLLRAWFLDPATRMNPNLNFAQAIPGITEGRGEGIIELVVMPQVIESVGLVAASGALTNAEARGIETWFGDLVDWMQSSRNGKDEAAKANNHGIYYDYFLTHFALFAGKQSVAKQVSENFLARRLGAQMAKDGSLPEELSRTRSLHYSFFALQAGARMATISECVEVDLWHATTADGRGLARGLSKLASYAPDWKSWPYPESALADPKKLAALHDLAIEPLRMMAWGARDPQFEAFAQTLIGGKQGDNWLAPYPASNKAKK